MKFLTTTLTALFLALGATTIAQPGSLDSTFNVDGKVTTDFGTGDDLGWSVAIQSDGKIVVAGYSYNGPDTDFALARYNADGTLDNSFGTDGKVTTDFGSDYDIGYSVAIQSDGKIVVAGFTFNGTDEDFAVARYNADGTLDNSFSVDGTVTTDFGSGFDIGYSVAIQSDGKIVVAGYSDNGADEDFALARYNTDGTLDNSFGVDGTVITAFGSGPDIGYSVAIQSDGKIVVAGFTFNGTDEDFAVARYSLDGTLDNSFGVDGTVTTDFGMNRDFGFSVAIQPNGKILVAGASGNGFETDVALARYNLDGILDNSFSVDGTVITNFGSGTDGFGYSVAIQSDGKIVVAGYAANVPADDFALTRYNSDGTLDNSFSVDGKVITDFGSGYDSGRSVAIQPDGKVVVAGYAANGTDYDLAVARYISGLNIGIIDLSLSHSAPLIYPNPIDKHATLQYTLQNDETISIHLIDLQGKTLQTFINDVHQAAGEHQHSIDLSEALPSGTYLIVISSARGKITVQVVK